MEKVTLKKLRIVHKDARGTIMDLLNSKINHVGIIVTEKGGLRANHYHKRSMQYDYLFSGTFEVTYAPVSNPNKKKKIILRAGYLITIPSMYIHSFKAKEKSVLINMMSTSREGKRYEKDVYRVEF